jgi:hypothetical protein
LKTANAALETAADALKATLEPAAETLKAALETAAALEATLEPAADSLEAATEALESTTKTALDTAAKALNATPDAALEAAAEALETTPETTHRAILIAADLWQLNYSPGARISAADVAQAAAGTLKAAAKSLHPTTDPLEVATVPAAGTLKGSTRDSKVVSAAKPLIVAPAESLVVSAAKPLGAAALSPQISLRALIGVVLHRGAFRGNARANGEPTADTALLGVQIRLSHGNKRR